MKRSGEGNAEEGATAKKTVKNPAKGTAQKSTQPISISSFPAKMAAAIERKRRKEKLSRTDYFIRLALKDLFKPDKAKPEGSDGVA